MGSRCLKHYQSSCVIKGQVELAKLVLWLDPTVRWDSWSVTKIEPSTPLFKICSEHLQLRDSKHPWLDILDGFLPPCHECALTRTWTVSPPPPRALQSSVSRSTDRARPRAGSQPAARLSQGVRVVCQSPLLKEEGRPMCKAEWRTWLIESNLELCYFNIKVVFSCVPTWNHNILKSLVHSQNFLYKSGVPKSSPWGRQSSQVLCPSKETCETFVYLVGKKFQLD